MKFPVIAPVLHTHGFFSSDGTWFIFPWVVWEGQSQSGVGRITQRSKLVAQPGSSGWNPRSEQHCPHPGAGPAGQGLPWKLCLAGCAIPERRGCCCPTQMWCHRGQLLAKGLGHSPSESPPGWKGWGEIVLGNALPVSGMCQKQQVQDGPAEVGNSSLGKDRVPHCS